MNSGIFCQEEAGFCVGVRLVSPALTAQLPHCTKIASSRSLPINLLARRHFGLDVIRSWTLRFAQISAASGNHVTAGSIVWIVDRAIDFNWPLRRKRTPS